MLGLMHSGVALGAFVLLGAASPAPVIWDVKQAANAPVFVTDVSFYKENAAMMKIQEIACVSFRVGARPISMVQFRFAHRTSDGSELESTVLTRERAFDAGAIVDGHPLHSSDGARENCIGFTAYKADAPMLSLRVAQARFVDGTTWTSPPESELRDPRAEAAQRQEAALARFPAGTPRDAVPWDAAHHTGYVAVLYGGNDPQTVAIFSPGAVKPSSTLSVHCCAYDLAFLRDGSLAVGGLKDGIQVFAPGASTAARSLSGHGGFSLAASPQGDLAIGGYNSGPDIAVYPAMGESFRVPGRPHFHDLAFSADGELAVGGETATIVTYPRGRQTPGRKLTVARASGSLAYGPAGQLAVASYDHDLVAVFPAGADTATFEVKGVYQPRAVAFDARGRLLVAGPRGVQIFDPKSGQPERTLPLGGTAVATAPDGTIAVAEWWRNAVGLYAPDGTRLEVPGLFHPQAVAISP